MMLEKLQVKTKVIEAKSKENITLAISIVDFNALGFAYGDSVDIGFANGFHYDDVPYYSGYYAKRGHIQVVAYQGYQTIDIARTRGYSPYLEAKARDGMEVTITLKEKAKYLETQNMMNMTFDFGRDNYHSDEEYANFRMLKGGRLKENLFYRSCSVFSLKHHERSLCAQQLLKKAGVKNIVCLAENKNEAMAFYSKYPSDYLAYLIDDHSTFHQLNENYSTLKNASDIANALYDICQKEPPYSINCILGINRTGFVSSIIEALAHASDEELLDDFMQSYRNYYHLDADRYTFIRDNKIGEYFDYFDSLNENNKHDTFISTCNYLKYGGLTQKQIDFIIKTITK